ncbi:protein of unknown function [Aminobacter niigataensis]|nr:protein of unknown function [Aminobacter niigataensis]
MIRQRPAGFHRAGLFGFGARILSFLSGFVGVCELAGFCCGSDRQLNSKTPASFLTRAFLYLNLEPGFCLFCLALSAVGLLSGFAAVPIGPSPGGQIQKAPLEAGRFVIWLRGPATTDTDICFRSQFERDSPRKHPCGNGRAAAKTLRGRGLWNDRHGAVWRQAAFDVKVETSDIRVINWAAMRIGLLMRPEHP